MKDLLIPGNDFDKLFNKQLTSKLIGLHAKGYDMDFHMNGNNHLVCSQTGECFHCGCIIVKLVDQAYDFMTNTYKYLHTIDTACGEKGIMVMEGIYNFRQRPVMRFTNKKAAALLNL